MVFSHCLFQRKIRQKWKKRNILQFNNVRFDLAFFAKCRKLNFESAKTIEFSPIFLLGQGPVEQSSTNKPLAMRVVEDALAYSKKPPVI